MRISHEPSIWVGDRGTWQFMVNTSKDYNTNDDYGLGTLKANFSHNNEVAKAHYYKVSFDGNGGDAANSQIELTPTSHGAAVRFTYNNTANKSVIFDCANGGAEIHLKHILTIQGMVRSVCTFTENLVRLLRELK